jgi:hypothetical protein
MGQLRKVLKPDRRIDKIAKDEARCSGLAAQE